MAELKAGGLEGWLAELLARRGVGTAAEAELFLRPGLEQLHDPKLLDGIREASSRLKRAHEHQERVAIVGDYDADGVSGTALLAAVLRYCGLQVTTIIPDRLRDGYGFQVSHAVRAQEAGCSLVVTVDCGTSSREAAQQALDLGLGVIVTDHHLAAVLLPPDVILVNPNVGGNYPCPHLSGAGVAFKLAVSFADEIGRPVDPSVLLRVACLGTIGDLVPLKGENRVIVSIGLAELAKTKSVGLLALMTVAGVKSPVTAADVGYRLVPRLNAVGRLGSADGALELLLTRDQVRARVLAEDLEEKNRQRQALEATVAREAREMLVAEGLGLPAILVAWSKSWHRGVVGIAAGRLARELNRPTILLAVEGDEATGSGRSIQGINLHDFLLRWNDTMLRFGGHSQAIGLSVEVSQLDCLRDSWQQEAEEWRELLSVRSLEYEIEFAPGDITSTVFESIEKLGPFGRGNREPLIRFRGPLRLLDEPRIFGKGHLSAEAVGPDGSTIRLLGWNWADRVEVLRGEFELLGHLEMDRYRGTWILRLVDCRPTGKRSGLNSAGEFHD